VFKLTLESGGKWGYSIIHKFNGANGEQPEGSLVFDSAGNLYGVTELGGAHNQGTVFELSLSGNTWKEKVLYNFTSTPVCLGGLILDASGNLYGTDAFGGANSQGEVFELVKSGNQWQHTTLYGFTGGSDGGGPSVGLVRDSSGNLYSTTYGGGANGLGVVFELTPGSGGWTETVLHTFAQDDGGANPNGGVVFDTAGNLYGTTYDYGFTSCDGGSGCGTVFELTPAGGHWNYSVLHAFRGPDGKFPVYSLTLDSGGNVCGVATDGGKGNGLVFKLTQSGGHWKETVLHFFSGEKGAVPYGGLILDQGVLYGTALRGGLDGGDGLVFSITP
jgi:uncharacterized repeat protein (TIGR03803 family)